MNNFEPTSITDAKAEVVRLMDEARERRRREATRAHETEVAIQRHKRAPVIETAASLRLEKFEPLAFTVPGIIVEGLVLLAGKPKVCKSWFALDVAIAVSMGRYCLGNRKCQQGDVLALMLEDGKRRLQRRIDKLLSPFGEEWPERLHYATIWPRGNEGVDEIDKWCETHPEARLIIVDVLARFRASAASSQNAYQLDYQALANLQGVATKHGVTILVIHHTRKGASEDPVEEISGTLGLAGAADAFLVLKRDAQGGQLIGRGRDTEDIDLAVLWNRDTCRWAIMGSRVEVQRSAERTRILDALAGEVGGLPVQEIAAAIGADRGNVDRLLYSMGRDGEVVKLKRGQYCVPGMEPPDLKPQTSGKIGKKVRFDSQAVDNTNKNSGDQSYRNLTDGAEPVKNRANRRMIPLTNLTDLTDLTLGPVRLRRGLTRWKIKTTLLRPNNLTDLTAPRRFRARLRCRTSPNSSTAAPMPRRSARGPTTAWTISSELAQKRCAGGWPLRSSRPRQRRAWHRRACITSNVSTVSGRSQSGDTPRHYRRCRPS
jgi:hypothetical protein